MSTFLIRKDAVPDWIQRLARENAVYFPQRAGQSGFRFEPVQEGSEIQFEQYHPTIVPPGKKLAPAGEVLFQYRREGEDAVVEPVVDASFRILAGVRPCDLKGIDLMDQANRAGAADPHYLTRRANTAIIAYDCLTPCDNACFCDATGSLRCRKGADIFLTPVDEDILVEPLTERGLALLAGANFPICGNVEARKAKAEGGRAKPFGRQFKAPLQQIPGIVAKQWQSPVWEKHVQQCFSCGSCNLVCPTCYCFNVQDDFNLTNTSAGQRSRTWEGCMLPNFAEVAGGHNFRPHPADRQRHRVKRKFEYLTKRFEEGSFCTGCGRCGRQCTAGIDIFDIVNDLVDNTEATP